MRNQDNIPALGLFCEAIKWVKGQYATFRFFAERDIVWTVQKKLLEQVETASLPYAVVSGYRMPPGSKDSKDPLVDLVIFERTTKRRDNDSVELAVEFKYQWKRGRQYGDRTKFPLAVWSEVEKDMQRVRQYCDQGWTKCAVALLIDEGGHFRDLHKNPGNESVWKDWKIPDTSLAPVWVLWTIPKTKRENVTQ